MDDAAPNYDATATMDDGSCNYSGVTPANNSCGQAAALVCNTTIMGTTGGATNLGAPNLVSGCDPVPGPGVVLDAERDVVRRQGPGFKRTIPDLRRGKNPRIIVQKETVKRQSLLPLIGNFHHGYRLRSNDLGTKFNGRWVDLNGRNRSKTGVPTGILILLIDLIIRASNQYGNTTK
jgi:hypothetical protein